MFNPFDPKSKIELDAAEEAFLATLLANQSIAANITPVDTKLPTAALEILKAQLEANYRFNKILYDLYSGSSREERIELNKIFYGKAISEPILKDLYEILTYGIKRALEEDVNYFSQKLKLLTDSPDQQRVLDDIYEDMRYQLFARTQINNLTDSQKISFDNTLIKKICIDGQKELFDAIEPHISECQAFYMQHFQLVSVPQSQSAIHSIANDLATTLPKKTIFNSTAINCAVAKSLNKTAYSGDFQTCKKYIINELKAIEANYRRNHDLAGLQDIARRLALLNNPAVLATQSLRYGKATWADSEEKQTIEALRAVVYIIHNLLVDAAKGYGAQLDIAIKRKKEESNAQKRIEDQKEQLEQERQELEKQESERQVSSTVTASVTKVLTATEFVKHAVDTQSESTKKALMAETVKDPLETKASKETLEAKIAKEVLNAKSKTEVESRSETLLPLPAQKPVTPLVFSAPSQSKLTTDTQQSPSHGQPQVQAHGQYNGHNQAFVTPQNGLVTEHPLAKKLNHSACRVPLIELFSGSLSKLKIRETEIKNIFAAIPNCIWKSNGLRSTFSYKGTLGYAADMPEVVENGSYHKKGKDPSKKHGGKKGYLHAVVLAHIKDFLERVGVTPFALWPGEFTELNQYIANRFKSHASSVHVKN